MKKINTPAENQNVVAEPKKQRASRKTKKADTAPATEVAPAAAPVTENVSEETPEVTVTYPENSSVFAWFSGKFYNVYIHNAADGKAAESRIFTERQKAIRYAYVLRKKFNVQISKRAFETLKAQEAQAEA